MMILIMMNISMIIMMYLNQIMKLLFVYDTYV